jgi:flagellar basal body-associated protein FliL
MSEAIIRCANCSYEGNAKKNRSLWAQILVWISFIFIPLITILYYLINKRYSCPKCNSKFIGIKSKKGEFVEQKNTLVKIIIFIIAIFISIAVMGIVASVLYASLSSARAKAESKVVSMLDQTSKVYVLDNKSYIGFCNDPSVKDMFGFILSRAAMENRYICNENKDAWAMSFLLDQSEGHNFYFCIDSQDVLTGVIMDRDLTPGETKCVR